MALRCKWYSCLVSCILHSAWLSIVLDQFSRLPEVGGATQGKAREGPADVNSIHELLTNQILLPSSEVVVTRGDYAFAECEKKRVSMKMALFKAWITEILANPSLV